MTVITFSDKYNYHLHKVINTITSCMTLTHLEGAERFLENFTRYWCGVKDEMRLEEDTKLCYDYLKHRRDELFVS